MKMIPKALLSESMKDLTADEIKLLQQCLRRWNPTVKMIPSIKM